MGSFIGGGEWMPGRLGEVIIDCLVVVDVLIGELNLVSELQVK